MEKTFLYKSPIGNIFCTFDKRDFLIRIGFFSNNHIMVHKDRHPFFEELDAYFKGHLKVFKQKIRFSYGTDFQRQIWLSLKEIPYGEVRTYRWLAERIERPLSYRAVGQALKKNPLPIILPCHRIICSNSEIGGFSSGIGIKRFLLMHEKRRHKDFMDH